MVLLVFLYETLRSLPLSPANILLQILMTTKGQNILATSSDKCSEKIHQSLSVLPSLSIPNADLHSYLVR